MEVHQKDIEKIVTEVINRLGGEEHLSANSALKAQCFDDGVFSTMNQAIEAAVVSQEKLATLCLERRGVIIAAMRDIIEQNVKQISSLAVQETGLGKVDHKIKKNLLAVRKTPGMEELQPRSFSGDHGVTLVENAPYGVIGAITPSTNPSETIVSNSIGMIAAGNAVVFNCHPGAKKVSALTVRFLNRAIVAAGGPKNLLCMVEQPTKETAEIMMKHPKIRLLVVTGGPEIVSIAMKASGKKVIAAGPGNPPVVVDETANILQAARDIVDGSSFDNNVLCIAEKVVIVVESVADELIAAMQGQGAYKLEQGELELLTPNIIIDNPDGSHQVNRKYVGKDVQMILETIGVQVSSDMRLAIAEVSPQHPLVYTEQLMPVLPIVRVSNVDEAIELAYRAEQGNYHTATMHSRNVDNLSKMARKMNVSIFIKNAPSYSGLGMYGEGFCSYTIASPTGEGVTSSLSFTRQRRCVLRDHFRIV